MLMQAIYRYAVFPAYESLYQRRHTLRYLRQLERSQWQSPEEIQSQQFAALQRIVEHAEQHCPFYQRTWAELGLSSADLRNSDDFCRWPLVEKDQIRLNRLEMRSTRIDGPLLSKSTGGSTGTPLHFDLDVGSYERRWAATYRGYGWAGGSPGTKQFHLWGVPLETQSRKKQLKDRLYHLIHRRRMVNSFHLSEETTPDILRELNRYRPDVIVAYTEAIYQFARSLAERRLQPFSPKSIIVGAEKLHGFQRELIESVFRCPLFETYGSREFMLIGAECSDHRGLHLTADQLLVEILNDDGQPTPAGQVGNVVITDLFNYGMPFIRYVNGDQALAGFDRCTCGRGLPLLREVRGRRIDSILTPDGRLVPGIFFPHLFKDFTAVRQFQVVQPSLDRLEVRVVLQPDMKDSDRDRILEVISDTVGKFVQLDWQPVKEIPLTRAGKHMVVVSHVSATTGPASGKEDKSEST
jgi:phenylacetate-CoA ligase